MVFPVTNTLLSIVALAFILLKMLALKGLLIFYQAEQIAAKNSGGA